MITGFSHAVQLSVLLKAIGAGYFLGFVFSLVMLFNAFHGKSTVFVFIRDVLYFISAAIFTFLFALKYNAGTVRFYILAGEGIGFLLYYIFPGNLTGRLFRKAADKITEKTDKFILSISAKIKNSKDKLRKKLKENNKEKRKNNDVTAKKKIKKCRKNRKTEKISTAKKNFI